MYMQEVNLEIVFFTCIMFQIDVQISPVFSTRGSYILVDLFRIKTTWIQSSHKN